MKFVTLSMLLLAIATNAADGIPGYTISGLPAKYFSNIGEGGYPWYELDMSDGKVLVTENNGTEKVDAFRDNGTRRFTGTISRHYGVRGVSGYCCTKTGAPTNRFVNDASKCK